MDTAFQLTALAVVAACMCLVLRGQAPSIAMLLALSACVGILLLCLHFFAPVLQLLEELRELSNLSDTVTGSLIKVTGIGLLAQIACAVCEDSGEKALGKTVEIGSQILSLYAALPLLSSLLQLLKGTLGG